MRFFLRTKKFKIGVISICIVLALSLIFRVFSGLLSPGSAFVGVIAKPIQSFFIEISGGISNFAKSVSDGDRLITENKQLEEEINRLNGIVAENDELKTQNEFYKNYLEIKDKNPDFKFCPAKLISRDTDDPFCSFTINKGSFDGVKQYDPVIDGNYLIGYIERVGLNSSKVVTLLSPKITLGVNDSRTLDAAILTGTADFAAEGKVKLYNLQRNCTVAVGDYIVTSGEGVFPEGLLVGTVDNIKNDNITFSTFASVNLFADFEELKNVMVITDFENKGIITDGE